MHSFPAAAQCTGMGVAASCQFGKVEGRLDVEASAITLLGTKRTAVVVCIISPCSATGTSVTLCWGQAGHKNLQHLHFGWVLKSTAYLKSPKLPAGIRHWTVVWLLWQVMLRGISAEQQPHRCCLSETSLVLLPGLGGLQAMPNQTSSAGHDWTELT